MFTQNWTLYFLLIFLIYTLFTKLKYRKIFGLKFNFIDGLIKLAEFSLKPFYKKKKITLKQ